MELGEMRWGVQGSKGRPCSILVVLVILVTVKGRSDHALLTCVIGLSEYEIQTLASFPKLS